MSLKERFAKLIEGLCSGVYEREHVMKLSLLSSIAGESVFLLGPPGVAKSLIARRLKYAYKENKTFEYLMSRFSTPDEVFGPVSIKKLKDEDKYERIVENYLPGSNIIFLDEIWKASPPIQNALLTGLNEKKYRNGEKEIDVDIRVLISASNELPNSGEGLEALWDRFLLRVFVDCIHDQVLFNQMITDENNSYLCNITDSIKITKKEYDDWSTSINKIKIPVHILDIIHDIRARVTLFNEQNDQNDYIYISDRRWKKIVRLLKTSAFLNDRDEVNIADCLIIDYCVWDKNHHREIAEGLILESLAGKVSRYTLKGDYTKLLNDFEHDVNAEIKRITDKKSEFIHKSIKEEWMQRYKQCADELEEISIKLESDKEKEKREIKSHLFAENKRVGVLLAGFDDFLQNISQYEIQLEKIRNLFINK